MAFYKKRIVTRDTPEMLAERMAYRNACERATFETFQKFPQITAENFEEAVRFKEARIEAYIKNGSRPWSCTPYVEDCNAVNRLTKAQG